MWERESLQCNCENRRHQLQCVSILQTWNEQYTKSVRPVVGANVFSQCFLDVRIGLPGFRLCEQIGIEIVLICQLAEAQNERFPTHSGSQGVLTLTANKL